MNELTEFSSSDLIYLFLDGEITGVQQKLLFEQLAASPELQSELQQAVDIGACIRKDSEAIYPSSQLTQRVFATAGFANAFNFTGNQSLSRLAFDKMKVIAQKAWQPVAYIAAGALAASLIFLYNSDTNVNNATDIGSPLVKTELNSSSTEKASIYPNLTKQNPDRRIQENDDIIRTNWNKLKNDDNNSIKQTDKDRDRDLAEGISDNSQSADSDNLTGNSSEPEMSGAENLNNFIRTDILSSNSVIPLIMPCSDRHIETYQVPSFSNNEKINNQFDLSGAYELEINGMADIRLFPYREFDNPENKYLNNIGLSIKYNYNNNYASALKFGREGFPMYDVTAKDNGLRYDKSSNIYWLGIAGRYSLDEIQWLYRIKPYAELFAGGTKYGPIAKTSLGISYNPQKTFTFSFGLEGTFLFYRFRDQINATQKLGFVYNIGVCF